MLNVHVDTKATVWCDTYTWAHEHMHTHWPLYCVLLSQGNKGKETRDINPQQQVLNNVVEKGTHTYLPTPGFWGLGGMKLA